MKMAWIIGLVFCFVMMSILGSVLEMVWLGRYEGTTLQVLLSPPVFNFTDPITGIMTILKVTGTYIRTFFILLFWDFPMFEGKWLILKWVVWFPISVGIIYGFITMLTRRA